MNRQKETFSRFAIRWGGAAGDGLQSTGLLFQKFLNKIGYFVFGFAGTQSTIRGGHVWQHVEFSCNPIENFDRPLDLLIAMDTQSLEAHINDLKDQRILLYNSDKTSIDKYETILIQKRIHAFGIPLQTLIKEIDPKNPILANSVTIGVIIGLLNLNPSLYNEILIKRYKSQTIQINQQAIRVGVSYFNENIKYKINLKDARQANTEHIVISGNHMIALGAVASGLKFLAQYPITPASSILTYLAQNAKKFGVVIRQAEDEIAAIGMCIGASFAGVRSMTATSGPGISLMAELFGYAATTETPIVIVNSMRAGPSTGIPTKMEQSDLLSMIHLSHGESPRIVLAPRTLKECFSETVRAFNLADRYQTPVIILSDFALSERTESIEIFDLEVEINRGKIWKGPTEEFPVFKRYQITEDGVSPRAIPPTKGGEHIIVGAEHDEMSHSLSGNRCGLPKTWKIREELYKKRFAKLEQIKIKEMNVPLVYGMKEADYTILCWGSTLGAVKEAIDYLNENTLQTWNLISFCDLFPLPTEKIEPLIKKIRFGIWFEANFTGQMQALIKQSLGWEANASIHPLSGETPTTSMIISEIRKLNSIVNRSRQK